MQRNDITRTNSSDNNMTLKCLCSDGADECKFKSDGGSGGRLDCVVRGCVVGDRVVVL